MKWPRMKKTGGRLEAGADVSLRGVASSRLRLVAKRRRHLSGACTPFFTLRQRRCRDFYLQLTVLVAVPCLVVGEQL